MASTMKALRFDGNQVRLEEVAMPAPASGEALVRVSTAGVCNTDLELTRGYMAFRGTLGHEFVGTVEACEAAPEWLSKRVTGEINCVCHACRWCRRGLEHHCENRTVLGIQHRDGAFAEFLTLPAENLHAVPATLGDEAAVFTEPTAAAFRILEQVPVQREDRAIVIGDGKLGQLIAQVLALDTNDVTCIGRHSWKLQLLERLGFATALADEPVEPGADIVVEATGREAGLARALDLVRPEGTLVLKTTVAGTQQVAMSLPVVVNEVRILGSRCGPFPPALAALEQGRINVGHLVSEVYSLADGAAAIERAAAPDVMKVLLRM